MINKQNIIATILGITLIIACVAYHDANKGKSFGTINNGGSAVTASSVVIPAGTSLPDGYITPNPSTFDYIVSRGFLMAQNIFGEGNGTSVPTYQQVNRQLLIAATTTPCELQNPFNATSTIPDGVTFNITQSTSTALTLTFATSTSAFATTSVFSTQSAGANLDGTYTANGLPGQAVVAPNGWVIVGLSGVSYGPTVGGSCQATFQTAN